MSVTTQKIVLNGQHQQLIDLNKELTNFVSEFVITPHIMDLDSEYHVSIVTQKHLDDGSPIDFKPMKGIFEGNIKIDGNEYQNYFIIIKSDKPMREMNIKNTLTELPVYNDPPPIKIEPQIPQNNTIKESYTEESNNNLEIKIAVAIFVIALGGYMLYHFSKSNRKKF